MTKGPFGNIEVFPEDEEDTIKLIYEFKRGIVSEELRDKATTLVAQFEDSGVRVADADVDAAGTNYIQIELVSTNVDAQVIEDARNFGIAAGGYQNLIVSTVSLETIARLS